MYIFYDKNKLYFHLRVGCHLDVHTWT